jgi:acetyltransferase-like isoleucine patch superfamily enzyme
MPSIELASDVYTLIDKIRSGDDLTPHLSERVKIIYTSTSNSKPFGKKHRKEFDNFLNSAMVRHLHPRNKLRENSAFVEHGQELIHVVFRTNAAYLIDITDHAGIGGDRLHEIMVQNWQNHNLLLELKGIAPPYVLMDGPTTYVGRTVTHTSDGIYGDSGQVLTPNRSGWSQKERKELLSYGCNPPLVINDRVYIGAGYTSSAGFSIRTTQKVSILRNHLRRAEEQIRGQSALRIAGPKEARLIMMQEDQIAGNLFLRAGSLWVIDQGGNIMCGLNVELAWAQFKSRFIDPFKN